MKRPVRRRPVERRQRSEEREGRKAVGQGHRKHAEGEDRQGPAQAHRDDRDPRQAEHRGAGKGRRVEEPGVIGHFVPSIGRPKKSGTIQVTSHDFARMSDAWLLLEEARGSSRSTRGRARAGSRRRACRGRLRAARKTPDRADSLQRRLRQRERPDEEGGEEVEKRRLRMTAEVHREERETRGRKRAAGPGARASRTAHRRKSGRSMLTFACGHASHVTKGSEYA